MASADGKTTGPRWRYARRLLPLFVVALAVVTLWTGTLFAGVIEGWWRTPIAPRGDARAFAQAATAQIDRRHKGNAVFALLVDGKVYDQHFVSTGRPVDGDTMFQVASLSKWITAWGIMTLVDSGRIDLDKPVSTYLKRWQLPPSQFDNSAVTVRRLLSHTAGLTDGLGYAGFAPGQKVQSLVGSLAATADASPGADGHVRVGAAPGGEWHYSGGGFALLQLVIEDVTGQPFNTYMQHAVLEPLGMRRSTFVLPPDAGNVAEFFDADGRPAIHYRFAAPSAASLYTSAADLTRFLQAQVRGPTARRQGAGCCGPRRLRKCGGQRRSSTAPRYGGWARSCMPKTRRAGSSSAMTATTRRRSTLRRALIRRAATGSCCWKPATS